MLKLRRRGLKFRKQFTGEVSAIRQQGGSHVTVEHDTCSGRTSSDCKHLDWNLWNETRKTTESKPHYK